jgi:aryl-alcohol dehydrogenase-like predicted oxidoreductase
MTVEANVKSSRRNFLAAGIALPAATLANVPAPARTEPPAPAGGAMPVRKLGKTGLSVTPVAFGCMITSDASVIEKAADLGINYFDTARGYQGGNNERMVGAALKSKRKQLVISTKSHAGTKEAALADLDTSLREIGTDYVDIWYLHAKTKAEDIKDELLEAQRIAKQQGKIRFAGFSTHGGFDSVFPAGIAKKHFDVILTSYNFAIADQVEKHIADAKAAGIGVVAMKVMAGGFRTNRPGSPVREKLDREGAFLAALKWCLRSGSQVDTTIPSMTDMDQLDENLKAMTVPFADADKKVLAAQLRDITPMYCRACGGCEGQCPQGLPVPELVRFAMYSDGYGQFALGRENFMSLPKEVRDVRCSDCSQCAVQCRNGVHVAARLARAQALYA